MWIEEAKDALRKKLTKMRDFKIEGFWVTKALENGVFMGLCERPRESFINMTRKLRQLSRGLIGKPSGFYR